MAEVVGSELGLEAIGGMPERAGHDSGVGDHEIKRLGPGQQRIGAGAHARQRGKVERDKLESAGFRRGGADLPGRPLGFGKIARGADDMGAMRDQSARRLDAKAGGDAGDQNSFSAEVDARQNVVGGGCRAKCFRHNQGPLVSFESRESLDSDALRPICRSEGTRLNRRPSPYKYGGYLRLSRGPIELNDREAGPGLVRRPRADAARNRVRLMEVAKATFTELGAEVALEEIARRAGVGIGTLYRHFPTRDALLTDVYGHAVEQLAEAAARLSKTLAPVDALREWMRLFVDYIATKQVMAPALGAMVGGTASLYASSGPTIRTAISQLIDRAVAHGDIGRDIEPLDLLRAIMGVANVNNGPGWQDSAHRLIDILIDGLRAPRPPVHHGTVRPR